MKGFKVVCDCGESLEVNNNDVTEVLKNKRLSLDLNLDEEDVAHSSVEFYCNNCENFVRLEYM